MRDISSSSGPAEGVLGIHASALDHAAAEASALRSLLSAEETNAVPACARLEEYRNSMRIQRQQICRAWLLGVLIMVVGTGVADAFGLPASLVVRVSAARVLAGLTFVAALLLLPRLKRAWTEDIAVLLPSLSLLTCAGVAGAACGPTFCARYETFVATIICAAMIFSGAQRWVLVTLVVVTPVLMCGFDAAAGLDHASIAVDVSFWVMALSAFAFAGSMQEQARYRLFVNRLEREAQLQKVEAISNTLYRGARTDALTQVGNRLLLDERLAELSASADEFRDLWLLMVDVDHFKLLNDALGHPAGDECLRTIAATLGKCLRSNDMLARYGGEEFVALVRAPEAANVETIAERMREAVSALELPNPRTSTGSVTISIGIAAVGARAVDTAVARADRALYDAKRVGRNRVVMETSREASVYPMPGIGMPAA